MKQRIFITGATGYIGSAVAARLARAGHDVSGLTHHAERAPALVALGVRPVIGNLANGGEWQGVLQNCDSVVHTAFDGERNGIEQDLQALEAFRVAALDGRVRRVLYTSGIWVHGPGEGRVLDETAPLHPLELVRWRVAHEEIALDLAVHEVATVILRPGMVYGEHRGFLGGWFAEAHEKHTITYPGDGTQHWPMVHRDDLADAYVLALEHANASERYLLADDSHHTVRQMADAAAAAAGATARPWPAEELVNAYGLFGKALLNDLQVTAAKARRELGWVPRHNSFVAEAAQLWGEWQSGRQAPVA